jgi:alpha-glucosidase
MDYLYTAFHQASTDGTPVIQPLWFHYPQDTKTFAIDTQFLFGSSILVSPVIDENSTSVSPYFPSDIFYDFLTLVPVKGTGSAISMNVSFTEIPVHIRGGAVLPLRVESAMTTTELRKKDFEFVVAPGTNGKASGSLYIDDGESITPSSSTSVTMGYTPGALTVGGHFGFKAGVNVARVRVLGVEKQPKSAQVNGKSAKVSYDSTTQVLEVAVGQTLTRGFTLHFA